MLQFQPLGSGHRAEQLQETVDFFGKRELLVDDTRLAGADAREFQRVVHQPQHGAAVFGYQPGLVMLRGGKIAFQKQVGKADYGIKRRLQFLAQAQQEGCAVIVGCRAGMSARIQQRRRRSTAPPAAERIAGRSCAQRQKHHHDEQGHMTNPVCTAWPYAAFLFRPCGALRVMLPNRVGRRALRSLFSRN